MREKWDLLGYSAVTFFYAKPGAKHNRPPMPASAAKRIMSIDELRREIPSFFKNATPGPPSLRMMKSADRDGKRMNAELTLRDF